MSSHSKPTTASVKTLAIRSFTVRPLDGRTVFGLGLLASVAFTLVLVVANGVLVGGNETLALRALDNSAVLVGVDGSDPVDGVTIVRHGTASAQVVGRRVNDVKIDLASSATIPATVQLKGNSPGADGEASVSTRLAQSLDLDVGQTFTVGAKDFVVAGVHRVPSDRFELSMVGNVEQPGQISAADIGFDVLGPPVLFARSDRTAELSDDVEVFSVQRWNEAARPPDRVSQRAKSAPTAVGALVVGAVVLWVVALGTELRKASPDTEALLQSGYPSSSAGRVVLWSRWAPLVVGVVVGVSASLALTAVFVNRISSILGQDWDRLQVPWRAIGLWSALFGVGALAIGAGRIAIVGKRFRVVSGRSVVLVGAALVVIGVLKPEAGIPAMWMVTTGGALLAAGIAWTAIARFFGPGVRGMHRLVLQSSLVPFILAAVALGGGAIAIGELSILHNQTATLARVPFGSVAFDRVDPVDASALRDAIAPITDTPIVELHTPPESEALIYRMVPGKDLDCLRSYASLIEGLPACDQNMVTGAFAISAAGIEQDDANWLVDPDLLDDDNKVGIVSFEPDTGRVVGLDKVAASASTAFDDSLLIGLAPRSYNEIDAAEVTLILPEFSELRPADQATIFDRVFAYAPEASIYGGAPTGSGVLLSGYAIFICALIVATTTALGALYQSVGSLEGIKQVARTNGTERRLSQGLMAHTAGPMFLGAGAILIATAWLLELPWSLAFQLLSSIAVVLGLCAVGVGIALQSLLSAGTSLTGDDL